MYLTRLIFDVFVAAAEEEVVLTVLPDPPDKSLAAAQAHLKSWRASRRMPLLRADIATNVHTIFTERADLKQVRVSLYTGTVWSLLLAMGRISSSVLLS